MSVVNMKFEHLNDRESSDIDIARKVDVSLLEQGYNQFYTSILGTIFSATIILLGLYSFSDRVDLWAWYILMLILSLVRLAIAVSFKSNQKHEEQLVLWRNLFIFTAVLGGIGWGSMSLLLLPFASSLQQTLCLLILAGVTAGSIVSFSYVRVAAFIFQTLTLLPFVVAIMRLPQEMYHLYVLTIIFYLMYLIILTIRAYDATKKIIYLQFENIQLLTNLEKLATHDALTNIDNSLLFHINLNNAIKRAKRNRHLLALFYIDLDNFKRANDTYGHDIGDQVLVIIAKKIKNLLRDTDVVARIGGDEFTVILEQINEYENAGMVAKRICKALAEPLQIHEHRIEVSCSIGISFYPDDGHDSKALINAADEAMYYVKTHGRNNFHYSAEKMLGPSH